MSTGRQHPIELFMPPNVLKAKVGGAFAGVDSAALKRAEAAVETLAPEFYEWTGDDVDDLVTARDRFAASASAENCHDLLLASHTIKGQAATFNYPLMGRIAASLCRLIEQTNDPARMPAGLVEAHVAAVRAVYRDHITDDTNDMALALVEELESQTTQTLVRKPRKH